MPRLRLGLVDLPTQLNLGVRWHQASSMSTLELHPETRVGGGGRTPRRFLDVVIDGRSLYGELRARGYDLITCLGWGPKKLHRVAVDRLLRNGPSDMPGGLSSLFICAECGDLDCGAVGVEVMREGDAIVWRQLGYAHPAVEDGIVRALDGLGPYAFNPTEYFRALRDAEVQPQ